MQQVPPQDHISINEDVIAVGEGCNAVLVRLCPGYTSCRIHHGASALPEARQCCLRIAELHGLMRSLSAPALTLEGCQELVLCGVHVWLMQVWDASKHVEQAFQEQRNIILVAAQAKVS